MKDFDSVFQAIAHRTRREILSYLEQRPGPLTSSQIRERFAVAWPTLCEHLRKLEEAGVVTRQKRGREVYYGLQRQRLVGVVRSWIRAFES